MNDPVLPHRVVRLDRARARFGDFADRLMPWLLRGDPLADAVVDEFAALPAGCGRAQLQRALQAGIAGVDDAGPALRALFEQLDRVPTWVHWDEVDRAGELLFRTVVGGGLVLGSRSLALGYCAPAGNKPLMMSGQLSGSTKSQAARMRRRLAETGRFVVDVCRPGGMRRFGAGFAATVKVRIMHAQVRRLIRESGRWQASEWGVPINQHDMAATTLLFSHAFVQGVRTLGFDVPRDEAEAYLHLWRYNGWVIGVDPELLVATESAAQRMLECILAAQGRPDDDSRTLVHGLVRGPAMLASTPQERRAAEQRITLGYAFMRMLLGDEIANDLELPDRHRWIRPVVRASVTGLERIGPRVPGYRAAMVTQGHRYWEAVIAMGLEGRGDLFVMPSQLEGLTDPILRAVG